VATGARPALEAPAAWRCIDFISDLHLDPGQPLTWGCCAAYLAQTPADAVFILGDLFEVWVGDDLLQRDPQGFEARCVQALQVAGSRRALFFLHGNRDFLIGADFAQTAGVQLLGDPTVLRFAGQRWMLSHGDAMCLADHDYLQFRAQVRSPGWQAAFLARPLEERRALARAMRAQSEARKQQARTWIDLDDDEVRRQLQHAGAATLIHGHTHQPADHALGAGLRRLTLGDWDLAARPARAQVLRLHADARHERLPLAVLPAR
jgi:UDP-2,3-diacylglucosamine hydrolase